MKDEWIEIMKKTGRIKLSWWDLLTHYLIVLFLFLPLIFLSFDCAKYIITGETFGVRTPKEMFFVNIPFMILGVVFFFIQFKRLKFKIIQTSLPYDSIHDAIKTTANDLDWISVINTKYYKVFKSFPKWYTGSWGEQITIIVDNDKVMINSICDPDKKASVASFGRNRKNMKKLMDEIKNANR